MTAHTDHPLHHWDRTCPACQEEGRPVPPHRSGGGHWVGPTREETPSIAELIANVTTPPPGLPEEMSDKLDYSGNGTSELLPCPFCGDEAMVEYMGAEDYVCCSRESCGMFHNYMATEQWNRRAALERGVWVPEGKEHVNSASASDNDRTPT